MTVTRTSTSQQPTLRHLEQLMAQLLDGVILLDPTGIILSANAAALAMHGVTTMEELGTSAEDYARRFTLWTRDHHRLKHRDYPLFKVLAGESIPDMVVEVAPAGEDEARWMHQVRDVTMDVDGGEPDYLAVVLSDVSGQYDAEARFSAMFRANPAPAIIVRQHDMRVAAANPGFVSLTGFMPEQLVGRSLFGLDLLGCLPDRAAVRRQMEAGEVVPQTDAELLVADGSRRLVLFAGQPIDVTDEDVLLLTFADLQPRREAEQSLAASERHLQAVFEMAPVAMAITRDGNHRIVSVNAAFRELSGYDDAAALDHTADELGLWDDAEQCAATERKVAEQGSVRACEACLVSRSKVPVDCLISAETINVHGSPCVLWVYQDVTERRRSDAELGAAIDEVLKDASWLSRSILDRLATLRKPAPHPAPVELSPREREILDLICNDLDDAAIADRLSISRNTVRNHVARIYAKIGTSRRSGAVVWGRERGMGSKRD
ncbi:helix-turn-helix transcriptional regulator [Sphingomonas phyllosphaerae]|uniref:helix-turn-helix transcriptional regulator n=1 Tax=Sphingomonas phyllosphaerae TaxID=257003 RepID=UPI00048CB26E|nr:helix-turn-helix transcriptional regulator [Sphingomonas phyllosphaerae]